MKYRKKPVVIEAWEIPPDDGATRALPPPHTNQPTRGEVVMNERIALVVEYGDFIVRVTDAWGNNRDIYRFSSLEECLRQAQMMLGHPIVIPISGPNTSL